MIRRILKITAIFLLLVLGAATFVYFKYLRPKPLLISNEDRAAITMMPLPSTVKIHSGEFILNPGMGITIQGPNDDILDRAVKRFTSHIANQTGVTLKKSGKGLMISYHDAMLPVQPVAADESYTITIYTEGVQLTASTAYGILRGLESLKQLLKENNGTFSWPHLQLTDAPRYSWRGIMIDACRHWIPKEAMLRNIEAMAAVKMNVLHWHLSEYQGFRVESKVYPKLHELGSGGKYYSHEDIREIVSFAADRGIRVVPEFDMPGHTTSFFVGYPELASAPGPYQLETNFGVLTPVMDPTREEVYTFIDTFIGEMVTLFPDPYFHIGGDEVNTTDWDNNPAIQDFMKVNKLGNSHALQAYFNQRLEKILSKHNKKMIGWDEILNPDLGNTIVVQSWRTHKSLFEAVQQGSKAILSAGYYLDHKLPAGKHYGVDPEILPGAVTIQPDSLHWEEYALSIYVSESPMKTQLVLYGESDNLRGLFYLLDNATGFENALRTGNDLKFSFTSDFGEIDLQATFVGDSLIGKMSLGLLSFPFNGKKVGGNTWPGTTPPRVEQMKPLTPEQKANILGGEAAMWTEVASELNIDSRIWPRAAAIAEKLWSPQELTKDVRDMYRRLEVVSLQLDRLGVRHLQDQYALIHDLAAGKNEKPIQILLDVLEEVKYYERLTLGVTTLTPMNEVVDAVQPESMAALKFQWMVDEFLEDPQHQKHEPAIRELLVLWRNNHKDFEQVAKGNARLEKVLLTSQELSMVTNFALQAIEAIAGKRTLRFADREAMLRALHGAGTNRAGTTLAVYPAMKKLVEAIPVIE
ncbi:MAG: family 20 glycosylhydrolase [Cyclobacteriaceae bacterium]|nr:family 20 glycosylhydrolase [Cyclobacteriaceae bacterium]